MDESKLVLFNVDGDLVAVRVRDDAQAEFVQEMHASDAHFLGTVTAMRHQQFRQFIATRRLALMATGLPAPPKHKRAGTVTRWRQDETYGFIVDGTGRTWYVSRKRGTNLSADIGHGAMVSFTGSPHTHEDQNYPEAYSVTLITDDPEA